jgi:hypothetical protein
MTPYRLIELKYQKKYLQKSQIVTPTQSLIKAIYKPRLWYP